MKPVGLFLTFPGGVCSESGKNLIHIAEELAKKGGAVVKAIILTDAPLKEKRIFPESYGEVQVIQIPVMTLLEGERTLPLLEEKVRGCSFVLFASDPMSVPFAARLASRLKTLYLGDCEEIEAINGQLRVTWKSHGGNVLYHQRLWAQPSFLSIKAEPTEGKLDHVSSFPSEKITFFSLPVRDSFAMFEIV